MRYRLLHFSPEPAAKVRRELLARGHGFEPVGSYLAFRGRLPNADVPLANRGLQ
ncbi:MAG: hypothetical protein OHK0018_03410 [Erythrobacter tepidarius]